jgi:hypothetical protein
MHINCPTPISNPHPVSKDNKNILPPNNIDFSFEQLQHYFLFNIKKHGQTLQQNQVALCRVEHYWPFFWHQIELAKGV